jgi:hypothetical protein
MSQNSEALLAKLKQIAEDSQAIQALWRSLFREFTPPDGRQCHLWLTRYGMDTVIYGLNAAGTHYNKKLQTLEEIESSGSEPTAEELSASQWTRPEVMRYASGSMIRRRERGEE